jgi:hypothetical protein
MPPTGERTEKGENEPSELDESVMGDRIGVKTGIEVVLCRGECRDPWDP